MKHYRDEIRNLMITTTILDRVYEVAAKKIGVKSNILELFYALDDGKPHSQSEICHEWLVPKTTINTLIQECIRDGYITLLSETGSKEKVICLTDKGKEYARQMLDVVYKIERDAYIATIDKFSSEFLEAMSCFTNRLNDGFTDYFKQLE